MRSERTSAQGTQGTCPHRTGTTTEVTESPKLPKSSFGTFSPILAVWDPACPGWADIRNLAFVRNGNDLRGRCCRLGPRTSPAKPFNIHVSHHSQRFWRPGSMASFFHSPENMSKIHVNPSHRDVLKIYYEKGSVLWKNCAWGRDKSLHIALYNHIS